MVNQETIDDPDFGPMHFNSTSWVPAQRITINGIDIAVEIEPEDPDTRTLSPVQRDAARLALSLPSDVLEQAAPAVVQNYEVYREMIGDDELPPLASPVDVWKTVEPAYIAIPPHGDITTPTFLLMAECGWDPEHGLVVRFRNGHADAASQQGELGLDD